MIRSNDGSTRFTATAARLGREKKPSVISADSPVADQQRRHAQPRDGERRAGVGGWHVEPLGEVLQNRATELEAHVLTLRRFAANKPRCRCASADPAGESAGVQPTGSSIARHPSSPAAGESFTL